MSNCYDIEIKMDYFYENDSYEDMLEKKKEFENVADALGCLHRTVMALSAECPPKVRRWYYMPRRYLPPTSKNACVN